VLQSIKASDMSPLLKGIYGSAGGSECLDVLMKYMYAGSCFHHPEKFIGQKADSGC
jgi:actin related protein 2/3 complex, subunit 5